MNPWNISEWTAYDWAGTAVILAIVFFGEWRRRQRK